MALVLRPVHVFNRLYLGVIHGTASAPAIRERPGNPNSPQRIQPVGVLHALPLHRFRRDGIAPLERHLSDDLAYRFYSVLRHAVRPQEARRPVLLCAGLRRQFHIVHVMQQRGQPNDAQIRLLLFRQLHRHLVYPQ